MCRSCCVDYDNQPYVPAFPSVTVSTVEEIRKLLHDAACVLPRVEGFSGVTLDVAQDNGCGWISRFHSDDTISALLARSGGAVKVQGCYRMTDGNTMFHFGPKALDD